VRSAGGNYLYARPHPDPLPRGEGTAVARFKVFGSQFACRRVLVIRNVERTNCVTFSQRMKPANDAPSPGGEGWGEGEREHKLTLKPRRARPNPNAKPGREREGRARWRGLRTGWTTFSSLLYVHAHDWIFGRIEIALFSIRIHFAFLDSDEILAKLGGYQFLGAG
jgi:hypothetical protein